ncbi:MAG: transporter substrate-binding domain-containing protein, partial [Actinomycetia bacterium]|nr:transporter substrate-binding domain-containing protein [Actinomycetes bacterium]
TARSSLRSAAAVAASVATILALASCAQETSDPVATSTSEDACADVTTVKDGMLTVGTSDPAFPPYVIDNKPTNGKGFESAVAYAVAAEMGFAGDQVEWTFANFGQLFAPGDKDFDFALNQISITPKREGAVTFSDPYYEASNGVLVLKDSEFADVTSLAELQDAKIGVQIGTTALEEVETQIAPTQELAVFDDTTGSTQALANGQIDAIITDLPTTLYLAAVEVPGTVIGQLPAADAADSWGLVLEKDNALVACVNQAVDSITESGELLEITDQWMTEYSDAPILS